MGWADIAYAMYSGYNASQNGGGSSNSGGSSGGGTDFWGALLGGLDSWADNENDKDKDRRSSQAAQALARTTGQESRRTAEYTAGLADYYRRLQMQERRQGMSNFGQFARRQYNQTYTPPPVGAAPTAADYELASQKPTTAGGLAGVARGG